MEKFRFKSNESEAIVNAIIEGYREYIDHRRDRREKMTISSAFAWTKGNFIESKIAEISSSINLSYKFDKAGLTWDYLQFIQGDTKKLFLIKNGAYFNEKAFSQATLPNKRKTKGNQRTYLHELSKINQKIEFPSDPNYEPYNDKENSTEQLSLFITKESIQNELDKAQSSYNEFHILTYEIDEAYQISKIMHYLPNPEDNIAYKIEDLSDYISGSELTDEEREVIAPEQERGIIDPAEYDIGILEIEEEN